MIKPSRANDVSAFIRRRAKTMRVEKLGDKIYRVTPAEQGKLPRLVRFHVDIMVECFDPTTKEGCPANDADRMCSHVEAAINELLKELLSK